MNIGRKAENNTFNYQIISAVLNWNTFFDIISNVKNIFERM